ncbi:MAG: integral rane sensor signal transduction histidine kinase, partial [Solirubrobacterales bacterium]|nr:integral rane sensor signal transduction histidine kinase [Solirubrobacterales bacterium]
FVADASHELRTPLAMLRTELDLMAQERPTGVELDTAVASLREEVTRLASLAEDLLVLARAEDGRLPVRPVPLPAGELLTRVAERYARTTPRPVIAEASEQWILGDPLRLEQALGNLVDNALHHGEGEVRLRAVASGALVELHVTDEGAGFASSAFEPFAREDAARAGDRAGLGLAIVRAIARGHGGDADVSRADVWVSVPAHAPSRTGELLVIDR